MDGRWEALDQHVPGRTLKEVGLAEVGTKNVGKEVEVLHHDRAVQTQLLAHHLILDAPLFGTQHVYRRVAGKLDAEEDSDAQEQQGDDGLYDPGEYKPLHKLPLAAHAAGGTGTASPGEG